jgi:hypothetical protein
MRNAIAGRIRATIALGYTYCHKAGAIKETDMRSSAESIAHVRMYLEVAGIELITAGNLKPSIRLR